MSNIVNEKPTKKSGLYKTGFTHKNGGIFVLVDSVKPIETEVLEYHIPRKMILNTKQYSFKNKTNLEMLDYIFQDNDVEFTQGLAESQDHIVCRLAVLDKTKKSFNGSCLDLFNLIQGEHGCRLSENEAHDYKHRLGGSITPTDTDIESLKEKIKKVEDVNLFLQKYISENEKNILDLKVKDYKNQLSINKKTIKSYNDRIKEISKEKTKDTSEFDNLLIKGECKKAKIEKEINSKVYVRFEDGTSEIMSKENYNKYKKDFSESELKKGIKAEEEHKETLEKLSKGEIGVKEGIKEVAQAHLSEDPAYYEKLEEVENPFGKFIEIVKSSKDSKEAFEKAKKIKDVPQFVADEFSAKYNPDGKLSMEKAFEKFYNEHKEDDLKFKVTEQELPFKGNPNAKWVKVTYFGKDGETLMQGVAIDLYGSKEKAIEAAKEKIKSQLEKDKGKSKESEKQELKDLIDLLKEQLQENPDDQESKDTLELYEETLKNIDSNFENGGELNAEESIINAPCINKKFKFIESSDYNEYRIGGEVGVDKKSIFKEWKNLVNMSAKELKDFLETEDGKEAGLSKKEADDLGIHYGRESAKWIIKMKSTPVAEWTDEMWDWAKRQISFIKRMSGNEGKLYDDKGNRTRKHTSLLIWGHNPEKYENGGSVSFDKIITASSRFKPTETVVFDPPLEGKNGAKLISYTWSYEWTMLPNYEGELKSKRVSDWTQAEISADTGRDIVHQYTVLMPDGEYKTVSSDSVPILLGYVDRKELKSFPNLVTASKTLAKQQMQLAIMEAQKKEYDELYAKFEKAEKPEIKKLRIDELPENLKKWADFRENSSTYFSMGDIIVWQSNDHKWENEKVVYIEVDKPEKNTIEQLVSQWISKRVEENGGKNPRGIYDLRNRVARQKRKVENILNTKMEDGGEIKEMQNELFETKGTLFASGGKIEVNKVSVYQTNFSGLYFSDLGGYFESSFTDVIDLNDKNTVFKDLPVFLFFKNPYDVRYSEKISIDDVIGAIIPKKMEKDARNIFDKHFISYVTYSDDANTEDKINAIKKLADINEDIILK